MATNAKIGMNDQIEVGKIDSANNLSVTFTTLQEIKGVTLPSASRDEIDVTHMGSGSSREFIAGLGDNGEISVEMNWVIGSNTDVLLKTIHGTGENIQLRFKVGAPASGNSYTLTETYSGFCKSYERTSPVGEARSATATFRISGVIV